MDESTLPELKADRSGSSAPMRAVILDYGEVISQPADPAAIVGMAELFEISEERFREFYASQRIEYDRGALDASQYWTGIAKAAGMELSVAQIAQLRQADVSMWSRLNPSVLQWVDELRAAGFKTAVLSNMHHDMVQHLRENGEWTRRFDCRALSSAIRMAKPDAAIFEHCLERLQVSAHEALFVDDRERNVQAAQKLGMTGIVAATPADLRLQLEAIGFAPLPK
jgi:putative hydrolase of the HAD superfamily